VLLKHI